MSRFLLALAALSFGSFAFAQESALSRHWLWSTAHAIPYETTSEQSGYFSIVEGKNKKIYVGTAKYQANAYLVEFDPTTAKMKVVLDANKEIGTSLTGFASQSKFHTRNNVGPSGKIYLGTKQGYPTKNEKRTDYPGGYPMVFDPATGKTNVYQIPIPHQGIISVTPDESRDLAYISTCSDERPTESAHFMILDLKTGKYRDLIDSRHMYAFIVLDHLGRAYHPLLGGDIARYDPRTDKLERLKQTIDGKAPTKESNLAHPESHPINWEVSPDRKTLYAVAMSTNQLYAYDLTAAGDTLPGRSLGKLNPEATATDCRAMCVAPDGTVWAGITATFGPRGQFVHVSSWKPGDAAPTDRGPVAIGNPDYTTFKGKDGKDLPYHHGVYPLKDGTLLPRYVVMGICAGSDGTVYITTLYPFTVHAIRFPKVAGLTTVYRHNSHADVILSRMLQTDSLDEKGPKPVMRLASLFVDQTPKGDTSKTFSQKYGVPLKPSVKDALAVGVDGVLLVAEHGDYPKTDAGATVYPKKRLFGEVVKEFERTGKVVPVFNDKHLADNWADAKWMYDTAKAKKIPLMAGSSIPGTWRYPAIDVKRGAKLKQIVGLSYHTLDAYGFHGLEFLQALAERRAGGETGVVRVRCLVGPAVWAAEKEAIFDRKLLDAALASLKERPIPKGKTVEELVKEPNLIVVDYADGLRVNMFTLNYVIAEWSAAWQTDDGKIEACTTYTQEARPFTHFSVLLKGIEKMVLTGRPTWPVERTLLSSGILDAALLSQKAGGKPIETPYMKDVKYESKWDWQQPPPPYKDRPIEKQ
jgi:sugar lactone lactonase YvrE